MNVAVRLTTMGLSGVLTKHLPKLVDKPLAISAGFGGDSELVG